MCVDANFSLLLRITNQQTLLKLYDFTFWENIIKFKDKLPEDYGQEYTVMIDEGKLIARTAFQDSLDGTDAVARTWYVWGYGHLDSPPEVQQTIQDRLFKGPSLFSDKTDDRLHSLKDSRETMKYFGIYILVTKKETLPYSRAIQTPGFSSLASRSTEVKGKEL